MSFLRDTLLLPMETKMSEASKDSKKIGGQEGADLSAAI